MQTKASIVSAFFPGASITELAPFGNGHINDTFKVQLKNQPEAFILQKINVDVFPDPEGLVSNHTQIQEHLASLDTDLEIPSLLPTREGGYLVMDEVKGAWRMMNFIRDSYSVEVLSELKQAREAGRAFGWFARQCAPLDASRFKEAIRDFHRLSFRVRQLDEAIAANKAGRLAAVAHLVAFYKARQEKLLTIEQQVDRGEIPLRVTHNDTKINNLLFRDGKACAVIDLDTVGPGILYFDFGDSLRTIANRAAEDEQNLDLVDFNPEAFEAFTRAYLKEAAPIVSPGETQGFYLAPVLMTFIMGIRFLADYLNGDLYYKTAFAEHNLVRSKVQGKLIESMEAQEAFMQTCIKESIP